MHKQRLFILLIIGFVFSTGASAQTTQENSGWLAWFNSYRFSKHFGLHFDAQVRSADNWEYVKNVLIRPGITYHFNAKNNVTLGYAYIGSFNQLPEPSKNSLTESRI